MAENLNIAAFELEKTENLITTYMERSLHASLKKHFCPDESKHELKIGRFVADACDKGTIFEIQTGNLKPLAKKLNFYLENTDLNIVIVRPVAQKKRILWVNADSGEIEGKPKFSSKHESIANGISDLFYLKDFLGNRHVRFCFPLMHIDEVRLLDGYGKNKKVRASSVDRLAGDIFLTIYIENSSDISDIVQKMLPNGEFSHKELAKSLKLKGLKLWSAQRLLIELNIISCKKVKNKLVFEKIPKD